MHSHSSGDIPLQAPTDRSPCVQHHHFYEYAVMTNYDTSLSMDCKYKPSAAYISVGNLVGTALTLL